MAVVAPHFMVELRSYDLPLTFKWLLQPVNFTPGVRVSRVSRVDVGFEEFLFGPI